MYLQIMINSLHPQPTFTHHDPSPGVLDLVGSITLMEPIGSYMHWASLGIRPDIAGQKLLNTDHDSGMEEQLYKNHLPIINYL